jgi:hypothetical protein
MTKELTPGYYWIKDRTGTFIGDKWQLAVLEKSGVNLNFYIFGNELPVFENGFSQLDIQGPVNIERPKKQ